MRVVSALFVCTIVLSSGRLSLVPAHAQSRVGIDPTSLESLHWRNIGPANTGGRIDDFAVARRPGGPDAIYVATASGGVFTSTNQGTSSARPVQFILDISTIDM